MVLACALGRAAEGNTAYLEELRGRADAASLHAHPQWLALLHFEGDVLWPGRHGHAERAELYLHPRGHRDARAELQATLEAFLDPEALRKDVEHPQCAFIARRRFLDEQLALDDARFRREPCPQFEAWRQGLGATGVSLIYPEGFMNNPASMFGHTLLRLDAQGEAGDVLGYAVDFTGQIGDDGENLLYLLKGVFGLYGGRFGINPYYEQLRRYAEWENRDIYEYRLDFDESELDWLLMHLWELRGVHFPYWFFTKNCSYQLHRLLEVAKPDLRDADALRPFVIPVDTLRAVVDHPGLVIERRHRPSPLSVLEHQLDQLSGPERKLARALAHGRIEPDAAAVMALETPRRAAVLAVAYDWLRYRLVVGRTDQAASQGVARQLLLARSRLGEAARALSLDDPPQPAIPPEESHSTAMGGVYGGWRDGESFVDLELRPSFHTLIDRQGGLPRDMQIRFLAGRLRIHPESSRVRLQQLVLMDVVSLSPRSRVMDPIAWRFASLVDTRRLRRAGAWSDATVWRSDAGVGLAARPLAFLHASILGTLRFDVGPQLDSDVGLGFGGEARIQVGGPRDLFAQAIFVDVTQFVAGETGLNLRAGGALRVTLYRNAALIFEGAYHRVREDGFGEARAGLNVFF